jgi:hypothetical protein
VGVVVCKNRFVCCSLEAHVAARHSQQKKRTEEPVTDYRDPDYRPRERARAPPPRNSKDDKEPWKCSLCGQGFKSYRSHK